VARREHLADIVAGGTRIVLAVRPWAPSTLRAGRRYGLTYGALAQLAAARAPHGVALVDDSGPMSNAELDREADKLAGSLPRDAMRIGLLCRNSRAFVVALIAVSRLGADVVLLNSDLAAPEVDEVVATERVDLVLVDGDDVPRLMSGVEVRDLRVPARPLSTDAGDTSTRRQRRPGRIVVLTSGTTGPAKGAHLSSVRVGQALPVTTLAHRIPWREGSPLVVTSPLFHGFALGFLAIGLGFGMPVVMSRRLEVDLVARFVALSPGCVLVGVPPVLSRLAAVGRAAPAAVISGAGLLHPSVAARVMGAFGPVLFNMYGSSEEGWSTLAVPADLLAAPGTVGRPAAGIRVEVLGDDGSPVEPGQVGHLCIGSRLGFAHYTGGGRRARRAGLADSGDLGHHDEWGRLFVDGRADDMVVTGGENVFLPAVENVLLGHSGVLEVRVDGVPDDEYGVRIEASVVALDGVDSDILRDSLREYAAVHLARFKQPRTVHIVDELPQTSTGKHRRPPVIR
jgi:acyl-CoA synthetase (AMP-forming)/AMP-acid ligase II